MKQDNKEAIPHLEALKYKPSMEERTFMTPAPAKSLVFSEPTHSFKDAKVNDDYYMNKFADDQRLMRGTGGSIG